jgi:hypothetical protein
VLVAPAQDEKARQHREDGVEREHPDAARAGDERAGKSGPTMRDRFIATPLRASADASCSLGTSSGTIAENTGQRSARPMPLANTSTSSSGDVMRPSAVTAQSAMAVAASQNCVAISQRRRSRMSASAPLGKPSRNTGKVDADCTSATQIGVLVSVVIVQAAATSVIHMHRLAVSQVLQSRRKTGSSAARGRSRSEATRLCAKAGASSRAGSSTWERWDSGRR